MVAADLYLFDFFSQYNFYTANILNRYPATAVVGWLEPRFKITNINQSPTIFTDEIKLFYMKLLYLKLLKIK